MRSISRKHRWQLGRRLAHCLLLTGLAALVPGVLAADPGYEAEIVGANPFAFSGPGVGYYPTATLRAGQTVTVIGQRIGEWVAIVPPPGSFSWIPVQAVAEQADGTGIITAEEARIRVGSSLNDAHHVFQVTAKKGTKVDILDQVYLKDQGQVNLWYKIRPPADEARYVAAENVKLPTASPAETGLPVAPIANPMAAGMGTNPPAPGAVGGAPLGLPAPPASPTSPMNRFQVVSNRVIPPAQPIGQSMGQPNVQANVQATGQRVGQGMDQGIGPSPGEMPRGVAPAEVEGEKPPTGLADDPTLPFDKRVASLETQLHMLRSREPSTWNLSEVQGVLEGVYADAKTPEEKAKATGLLAEVRRLGDLEDRYGRARKQHELTRQADEDLAVLQQRVASQVRQLAPRFTAQGILESGALSVDGQPTFVLKSADGFTSHYVVAPPGMNVKNYIGTNVGLHGEITNRENLPAPVLHLEQLTPLDGK
ncbi:MAG: hypothetical protein U1D30_02120 [Planctomycetota bacterium]